MMMVVVSRLVQCRVKYSTA